MGWNGMDAHMDSLLTSPRHPFKSTLLTHPAGFAHSPVMPPKFRQRGKKKKSSSSSNDKSGDYAHAGAFNPNEVPLGSGIVHAEEDEGVQPMEQDVQDAEGSAPRHIPIVEHRIDYDQVAPFGFVPLELKAYLKDAHATLLQLARDGPGGEDAGGEGYAYGDEEDARAENHQAQLLRLAILREVNGQELSCATDGECSLALETVVEGLDARRLRIFADRISGK